MNRIDSFHLHSMERLFGRMLRRFNRYELLSDEFMVKYMDTVTEAALEDKAAHYYTQGAAYLCSCAIEEIEQLGSIEKTKIYPEEVVNWVGYLYRFWIMTRDLSGAEVLKIAPFSDVVSNFQYHVLSMDMAVDRFYGL